MSKNAKFEEWYIDLLRDPRACAYNNPLNMPTDGDMHRAMEMGWQAALQSLEVTPELVDAAKEGLFGSSYCDLGHQGYIGDAAIHEALTAVFNAIKGQAK